MLPDGLPYPHNFVMWILPLLLSLVLPAQTAPHDRAFWQTMAAAKYAVPASESAAGLARELSARLGDPDPDWRDDIATTGLSTWIGNGALRPDDVRPLMRQWTANLRIGIGETDTNSVLLRSYSALMLAAVVARDNAEPFLTAAESAEIRDAALTYLDAERDVRGFDERLGWIHSAAHTADLLRALARSRHLPVDGQARILDAVGRKLAQAPVVFGFGEDERFARAVSMLLVRDDFALTSFLDWLKRVSAPPAGPPTLAGLRAGQNTRNMLAKLGVLLARQPTLPPAALTARDAILAAVRF